MTIADGAKPYRILSLDGGGTWSLVQARALMKIFPDAGGREILRHFDLVVANSGGAIVAASLGVDQSPAEIADFILDKNKRMGGFAPTCAEQLGVARCIYLPRFKTKAKRASLRRELGERSETRLMKWHEQWGSPHLLIPAFDCDAERATFFRTDMSSLAASRSPTMPVAATLLDAVHASTTAPVLYFDEPAEIEAQGTTRKFWDGAVAGYNNPVLAGVVEAIANGKQTIRSLAIGSGSVRRPPLPAGVSPRDPRFSQPFIPGIFSAIAKFGSVIIDDPPDAATFIAHVILGGRLPDGQEPIESGPVVRMAPVIRPVWSEERSDWEWRTDGLKECDWVRLTELDMAPIEQEDIELVDALANAWMNDQVPNQPIRQTQLMTAEIGHDTFSAALTAASEWLGPGKGQRAPTGEDLPRGIRSERR